MSYGYNTAPATILKAYCNIHMDPIYNKKSHHICIAYVAGGSEGELRDERNISFFFYFKSHLNFKARLRVLSFFIFLKVHLHNKQIVLAGTLNQLN